MAESVKRPFLGFGSGHDPGVPGLSPVLGSLLSGESAAAPHPHSLMLSLLNK